MRSLRSLGIFKSTERSREVLFLYAKGLKNSVLFKSRITLQALGPGALGRPRGSGWRGRWEGRSGWGTHVNPWLFHFNV